jgi:protein ImuB
MKRVLCLRFPNWPVQWRYVTEPSVKPQALVVHAPAERGKVRVIACCRSARKRGVRMGMLLAEAQSLWPGSASHTVRFEPHDLLADRQRLRDLVGWSLQFGPWVSIGDGPAPDCLLLDVTGCGYGFGGETGIAEKMIVGLARKGYWAVVAIADTLGAAWAVAHYGLSAESRAVVIPDGRHEEVLKSLPVEALRLPAREVNLLHEVKVTRIDQLLALPRADLPSRFGPAVLLHLDRALGLVPEVLKPEQPADALEKSWAFEPPVSDRYSLVGAIEEILERLLKLVPRNRLGVHRLLCSLEVVDRDPIHFPVELLRPTASQRDLMELVGLQIDRIQLPGEVSGLTVRIAALSPLEFRQDDLFGGGSSERGDEATRLIERLIGRLGDRAVVWPRLVADAQPELAFQYGSCLLPTPRLGDGGRGRGVTSPRHKTPPPVPLSETGRGSPTRPICLKNRPVPISVVSVYPGGSPRRIHWNDRDHLVERSWGPERIETGWWRGDDIQRDYFVVQTTQGERLWLFRDLTDGSWFVHGMFE